MSSRTYNTPCQPLPQVKRRVGLWARLWQTRSLRQQRLHLAQLDDHLLRDIGLTNAAAAEESRRPVWDVPQNWRK